MENKKKTEQQEPQEIEILDYAQLLETEFMRLYYELDVAAAPEKRKPFIIDSIWMDLYPLIFKPDTTKVNNSKSKLMYHDVKSIEAVVDMYIKLCMRFNGVIKYTAFCNLIGINRYTIDLWNKNNNTNGYIFTLNNTAIQEECNNNIYIEYTVDDNNNIIENRYTNNMYVDSNDKILSHKRFDIKKKLHDYMLEENTNGLSGDTVGYTIRANNDEELGKLYDPKKIVLQQQAKQQCLSMQDLKLLE